MRPTVGRDEEFEKFIFRKYHFALWWYTPPRCYPTTPQAKAETALKIAA